MTMSLRFWLRNRWQAGWLVCTFGVSIAVVATLLAVVNAVYLRRPPVEQPEGLFYVYATVDPDKQSDGSIYADEFAAWTRRQDVFSSMASYQLEWPTDLRLEDRVERIEVLRVTTSLFETLGARPTFGRFFRRDEAVGEQTAVLSAECWRRLFASDPAIVGRVVHVSVAGQNQEAIRIIGVAPDGLEVRRGSTVRVDLYRPITDGRPGAEFGARAMEARHVIARLSGPELRLAATGRMTDVVLDVGREVPARPARRGAQLVSYSEEIFGPNRRFANLVVWTGLFVLIVGFANGFGVLLALASRRTQEYATRVALGASRARLALQAIGESMWIAAATAFSAVVAATVLTRLVVTYGPGGVRGLAGTRLGMAEVVGLSGLVLAAVALMGVVPLLTQRPQRLAAAMKATAGGTMSRSLFRIRRFVLAAQLAVVFALLVAAALTSSALWRLVNQPLGFEIEGVTVTEFSPSRQQMTAGNRQGLLRNIRQAVPDDIANALAVNAPLGAVTRQRGDLDGTPFVASVEKVSEGYWEVLRVPILAGRDFGVDDYWRARSMILSESFARRWFGTPPQALGKYVVLGSDSARPYEIVGVVSDVRHGTLQRPIEPTLYVILGEEQATASRFFLLTRSRGRGVAPETIRSAIQRVDPLMYVKAVPLAARLNEQTAMARLQSAVITALGLFTLLLASVGIYAIVAQLSADRHRELAIRLSLGASHRRLITSLAGTIVMPVMLGLGVGIALAYPSVRLLERFVFQTNLYEPGTWFAAAIILTTTVGLAALIPARRAARMSPFEVLRHL